MKFVISNISRVHSRTKTAAIDKVIDEYMIRIGHFCPCVVQTHPSEATFLSWLDRASGRTVPSLILLDRRGKQCSSDDLAVKLGRLRDSGTQIVILAIGPPDGWSSVVHARAGLVLSFGPMTLPHEIARLVLAEQVYRALTILAGHPYHSAH